jgi:polysaccharide biosynthesis protein PslG
MAAKRAALAVLLALSVTLTVADDADAALGPRGFYGLQAWVTPSAPELAAMGRARVGVYRTTMSWAAVEPERGLRRWAAYDALVGGAARNGMSVLPVLLGSPPFAARRAEYPPRPSARSAYFDFVYDAVARYGRDGEYWRDHPEVPYQPVTTWQIWNEPNMRVYWNGHPNAASYVRFLSRAYAATKEADPRARVLMAGLPETRLGIPATRYLRSIYRVRGAARYFDGVAIHPYARDQRGVWAAVQRARRIQTRARDWRTPLYVTEIGWATAGQVDRRTKVFKTSIRGQSRRLYGAFKKLARNRFRHHIALVCWFSWRDNPPPPGKRNGWGNNTGLLHADGRSKPAFATYRRFTGGTEARAR